MCVERGLVHRLARRRDDEGDHLLSPFFMGPTDHGDFMDGGVKQQRLLHLTRVNVCAARDDHVLRAVAHGDEAVLVHHPDIACPEPAVADCLRRRFVISPVAAHDRRAVNGDFARFARRNLQSVLIQNPDGATALRPSDGGEAITPAGVCPVRDQIAGQGGDAHRAFALSVDLDETGAHDLHRFDDVGDIHRPAAIDD